MTGFPPLFSIDYSGLALLLSAIGIYFHAISITIVLGTSPLAAILEFYGIYRGRDDYIHTAKLLTRVIVVAFGFGAATGTLVEFGLIQVWNTTLLIIGSFAFLPLYLELVAFTIEAALSIALLYTWDKFRNPWYHWIITVAYAVGAVLSGVFIMSVNSWIQVPWGVGPLVKNIYPWAPVYGPTVANTDLLTYLKLLALNIASSGEALSKYLSPETINSLLSQYGYLLSDPWIALKSPYALASIWHQIMATFIVGTSWVLAGLAYTILKSGDTRYLGVFKGVSLVASVSLLIQGLAGHEMGVAVYKYQPTKFALIAGLEKSGPDPFAGLTMFGDPNYVFPGFDVFIKMSREAGLVINGVNIALRDTMEALSKMSFVYPAYLLKINLALLAGLITLLFLFAVISKNFWEKRQRILLYLAFPYTVALTLTAILGWAVREIGRKPWTIYGLFYPNDVITSVSVSTPLILLIIGGICLGVVIMIYTIYVVLVRPPSFLER